MSQQRKIEQAMRDAEYYRDGTNEELRKSYIEESEANLAGKSYTLSKISYLDAKIFTLELDSILMQQNPIIADVYARYAASIFDAVRMVNVNSKQGFKGALASGNELDIHIIMARSLYDPDSSGSARSSWSRTISSTGSKNFFEGTSSGAELTMGEEEAMVWLAFYNPALAPCVDSFQIIMNTEPFDIQALDFEMAHEYMGDPIVEFKEPWTLPPEQSGEILAYYFQTGTDEMRPLGVWIKKSREMRDLTDVLT